LKRYGAVSRARSNEGGLRRLAVSLTILVSLVGTGVGAGAAYGNGAQCSHKLPATSNSAPSAKLLSTLGVLRRAKAPSDALPTSFSGPPPLGEGLYVNYIRRARVVAGTSYYVIPVKNAGHTDRCPRTEEAFLTGIGPTGISGSIGASQAEIARGEAVGTVGSDRASVVSGIVPDGVAKVILRYPTSPRRRGIIVTAVPSENVFVASVSRGASSPRTIVWRSVSGTTLKTIHLHPSRR